MKIKILTFALSIVASIFVASAQRPIRKVGPYEIFLEYKISQDSTALINVKDSAVTFQQIMAAKQFKVFQSFDYGDVKGIRECYVLEYCFTFLTSAGNSVQECSRNKMFTSRQKQMVRNYCAHYDQFDVMMHLIPSANSMKAIIRFQIKIKK